tara:strand:+ start:1672 stop:1872 length:201 start_codon:yes stop_codon:yes gene_type:complete
MSKGFASINTKNKLILPENKKKLGNERMISWSPWPPANFQSRYPAFPLVMTIFLLILGQLYILSVQ